MVLSRAYLDIPVVMLTKDGNAGGEMKVAMPADLFLTAQMKMLFPGYSFCEYKNYDECFGAILSGEANATFANSHLAREYAERAKYSDLVISALNDCTVSYCSGVSLEDDIRLVAILDKSLACISNVEIDEFIITDTLGYDQIGFMDLLYQNPLDSLIIAVSVLGLLIALMTAIVINKSRYLKQINKIVNVDKVTGGLSSTKFFADAAELLSEQPRPQYLLAYTNIVKFKDINDLYGYGVGDRLLSIVYHSMGRELESGEIAARLHTDRFVVLLKCKDEAEFQRRYARLLEMIAKICNEQGVVVKFRLTAGIYFLQAKDKRIEKIIDNARYAHSQCDMEPYAVYDDRLDKHIQSERTMEAEMELALNGCQFKAFFQPKIDSRNGLAVGAEALVRWQHPKLGLLSPAAFIPLFEKNGFILKIDYFVFKEVCRYLAETIQKGMKPIPISCNFSRLHLLNKDFPEELEQIANSFGIDRRLLNIEITETIAMSDTEAARAQLDRLHSLGFSLSIDDFGSGYSSLGILSELDFDEIKLDRCLIENATHSEVNRGILSGVIATMQALGKSVVCEGVESREQIDLLTALKCYVIQGYYYEKPLPEEHFSNKYSQKAGKAK